MLGGGSSVNAQVYMRGRPSDYDEWDALLRGDNDYPGWGWADVLPHFRAMEGNNRLCDERHGADGPLLVSDPGHIDDVSRWFVQSVQALGEPFNHDFNGPKQRGVGFYQFTNRRGKRSSAAYAFLAPLEGDPESDDPPRRAGAAHRINNGRAIGVDLARRERRRATGLRGWRSDRRRRRARHAAIADAVGHRSRPIICAPMAIACLADLPGVGENLIDHPEVPIIAIANGRHGYYRQGVGWRMLLNGLQFKLFGTGRITSAGVEAGAFVNPTDPDGRPDHPGFLRADRLSRPRCARPCRRYLWRDGHHRGGEAEIARLRPARLGQSRRHAAGLAASV